MNNIIAIAPLIAYILNSDNTIFINQEGVFVDWTIKKCIETIAIQHYNS